MLLVRHINSAFTPHGIKNNRAHITIVLMKKIIKPNTAAWHIPLFFSIQFYRILLPIIISDIRLQGIISSYQVKEPLCNLFLFFEVRIRIILKIIKPLLIRQRSLTIWCFNNELTFKALILECHHSSSTIYTPLMLIPPKMKISPHAFNITHRITCISYLPTI